MDVSFKFNISDKVQTPLGDLGIVAMCAVDNGHENIYYIKTSNNSDWFYENQLTPFKR